MPEIELERRDDGIAVLTLNAPDRRNALTVAMAEALTAACEEIDADAAVGAVVVRGEGGYFCAGGDRPTLAAAGRDPAEDATYRGMSAIYRSFARVGELGPPTVAAIRGGAVGAGLNLALATDLRVVGEDAKLLSGFIPIGLHPGGGHTALQARPRSTASAPVRRSPNSVSAAAASREPSRPSSAVWPPPGCRPIGMKPDSSFASSPTTRRSVASARLSPAPTAPPRIAAIVGGASSPTRANER